MSIFDNLLAEYTIRDIISINSIRAAESSFNILFNIESMANFYVMSFSFFLTCHHFKKHKNSSIENITS